MKVEIVDLVGEPYSLKKAKVVVFADNGEKTEIDVKLQEKAGVVTLQKLENLKEGNYRIQLTLLQKEDAQTFKVLFFSYVLDELVNVGVGHCEALRD